MKLIRGDNVVKEKDSEIFGRHVIPNRNVYCKDCGALMWLNERISASSKKNPRFNLCCCNGKVDLPQFEIPDHYREFLSSPDASNKLFRDRIRMYNSALAFTSTKLNLDEKLLSNNKGIFSFRICGGIYHSIGDFAPEQRERPKFAQIYIYDQAAQMDFRQSIFKDSKSNNSLLDKTILKYLQDMLHDNNPYVNVFQQAGAAYKNDESTEMSIVLKSKPRKVDKRYNLPASDEIAVLIPTSNTESAKSRDIIVVPKSGSDRLQRISEILGCYDPLHYVLMFLKGEQGWQAKSYYLNQVEDSEKAIKKIKKKKGKLSNDELADLSSNFNSSCLIDDQNSLSSNTQLNSQVEQMVPEYNNELLFDVLEQCALVETNCPIIQVNVASDLAKQSENEESNTQTNEPYDISAESINTNKKNKQIFVSAMQFYCYRLQDRVKSYLHLFGRLFHQYIVDQYAKIEAGRLNFVYFNQDKLRVDMYKGLVEAAAQNDKDVGSKVGKRVILPSTFIGSPRHMHQLYQDSMSVVRALGKPDLFITFTCNPEWKEIKDQLLPHQVPNDRPDVIARVFRMKSKEFFKDIYENEIFGKVNGHTHVVEFQKRGLPHVHCLLALDKKDKPKTLKEIDDIVCAELPDKDNDPSLWKTVTKAMLHGPCGLINPTAPCMADNKCTKGFPKHFNLGTSTNKNNCPVYSRKDDGKVYSRDNQKFKFDNRWIVPYSPYLAAKYDAHINVEVCTSVTAIKYLYKYVYKGIIFSSIILNPYILTLGQYFKATIKLRWDWIIKVVHHQ
jgi:hypothetical protein